MSRKILYLLLAASIGLNAGIIGMTLVHKTKKQGPTPPHGPAGREGRMRAMPSDPSTLVDNHIRGITRHLALDPEQQQTIRSILEQYAPQLIKFQIDAAEAGRGLAEAYAAPDFDPEQIQQLTANASAARVRLDSLSAILLVAEGAVLTPDQRRIYAEVAPSIHSNPPRPHPKQGPPPKKGSPPPR